MRKIDKAKNFDFSTALDGRLFGVADIAKLRFRKGRKVGKGSKKGSKAQKRGIFSKKLKKISKTAKNFCQTP